RYYRKVGELLGFIINNKNNAQLTELGNEFFINPGLNSDYLKEAILKMKVFQLVLPYIESKQEVTKNDIVEYLKNLEIDLAHSTIDRRVSSLLSWLRELKIIKKSNDYFEIDSAIPPLTVILHFKSDTQPILPKTFDLNEYKIIEDRMNTAKDEVLYFKDQAKLERSTNAHIELVNLVAQKIRKNHGIPKSNQLIDLAVQLDKDYIFEMKSTNDSNVRSQVRKGMSQLYEYRYLQNKPNAKLVLVLEKPFGTTHSWMMDYMENDREINLVWDGDEKLYGSKKSKEELQFLELET
ncbi:MAG: DUF7226 domain-containing protein, partial [Thermodesulfobacteriota bacterium]